MMTEINGRLHRSYSSTTEIGDMEKLAEEMVGKPVTITDLGLEIGTIVSAIVEGDYIVWKAELHHG